MSDLDRFQKKTTTASEGGCLLWIGANTGNGYGQFWAAGRLHLAHRWAYERWVGQIPDGLQIDHTCNVRNCVNPQHLEAVTSQENWHRAIARGVIPGSYQLNKPQCSKGHLYADGNLRLRPNGHRVCRACQRMYRANNRLKQRDQR